MTQLLLNSDKIITYERIIFFFLILFFYVEITHTYSFCIKFNVSIGIHFPAFPAIKIELRKPQKNINFIGKYPF